MITLNDDSIFVGEIKQLLKDFSLPLCSFKESYKIDQSIFISENCFYKWVKNSNNNSFEKKYIGPYVWGRKYLNLTKNYQINNLLYDSDTHKYLGQYLRCLRDVKGLNLMSMYNCFCDDTLEKRISIIQGTNTITFDPNSSLYSIYRIPISLVDCLTISTHKSCPIRMMLYLNGPMSDISLDDRTVLESLFFNSYKKTQMSEHPLYYDMHVISMSREADQRSLNWNLLKKYENRLELILEVPAHLNSSITVLEGVYFDEQKPKLNYLLYRFPDISYEADILDSSDTKINLRKDAPFWLILNQNKKKILFRSEDQDYEKIFLSEFLITSELLTLKNNSKKALLGTRLIEYLTKNAITNTSLDYEIKTLQKSLIDFNYLFGEDKIKDYYFGIFNNQDKLKLEKYISEKNINDKFDVLGYLDKDVENSMRTIIDLKAQQEVEGDFS